MNEKYIEVLQQYDLELISARKGRGAWLCETNQGLKLVREYKGTMKRLEFEDQELEIVQNSGYPLVDRYVRSKEGLLSAAAEDGTRYFVKNWFSDRECNLKDSGEILRAVKQMAVLHKVLRPIEFHQEWNLGSILSESPEKEMERHNKELRRARNFIRGKRKKSEFELCVIGNFDRFYQQALEATEGMGRLCSQEETGSYLCHGDLNHHHILMGEQGIAIIEFSKMHFGLQTEDLYHFMRKVMEKHDWDTDLGQSIMEEYESVLPMTKWEKNCLYYLMLYPEKYWKQINFYYNANKAWIPERNITKLKNLEEQEENKNAFLNKIR